MQWLYTSYVQFTQLVSWNGDQLDNVTITQNSYRFVGMLYKHTLIKSTMNIVDF